LPLQYTRCLLTPVLVDIEGEGMCLDEEAVNAEYVEAKQLFAKLQTEMDALTGGINWRSTKQVAEYLYDTLGFPEPTKRGKPDRTPDGKRKTAKKVLEALKATTPEQKEFLRLRSEIGKVNALLTKNLEFFQGVCKEYGGVFHAEIHQTATATHRLSSTGIPLQFQTVVDSETGSKERSVQFQNTPRTLKRLFKAKRQGFLMAEPDGSQLEWRVAAFLSQDPVAIKGIEEDEDVHSFTASKLFNKTIEEVLENVKACKAGKKDSWRQLAKPNTFKPVYGGSKGTPGEERYFAAFREKYPTLAATQADWVNAACKDKELTTAWGLKYYFPTARMSDTGYANITSTVYNYPVQALATAEIIPIALVYLWHRIALEGLTEKIVIVNTVHDSAPCEVHPKHTEDFIRLAKQSFTHDVYGYLRSVYGIEFNVPLGVGCKIGQRWGVGDEVSYNVWSDGREVKK
jgi:DNA polymerase-1